MRNLIGMIEAFIDRTESQFSLLNVSFGIVDAIEILLISILFYNILLWFKNTRAWNLLKGIMVILLFVLLAAIFQMNTILWLAKNTLNIALIAVIIIFQPELRKALESLGDRNFLGNLFDINRNEKPNFTDHTIEELIRACYAMGRVKTGALIVMEGNINLDEYIRTGIDVDAVLSSQLLINIFEKNTPLHDGAVVVRGDRVISATCYLPLSDNMALSKDLGTRHRAAVGISEESDSLTIIVSEETGKVSTAYKGEIHSGLEQEELRQQLKSMQTRHHEENSLEKLKRGLSNVKKNSRLLSK